MPDDFGSGPITEFDLLDLAEEREYLKLFDDDTPPKPPDGSTEPVFDDGDEVDMMRDTPPVEGDKLFAAEEIEGGEELFGGLLDDEELDSHDVELDGLEGDDP